MRENKQGKHTHVAAVGGKSLYIYTHTHILHIRYYFYLTMDIKMIKKSTYQYLPGLTPVWASVSMELDLKKGKPAGHWNWCVRQEVVWFYNAVSGGYPQVTYTPVTGGFTTKVKLQGLSLALPPSVALGGTLAMCQV